MKRNRYDPNDRRAYDGRPTRNQALSPRNPPALRASGAPTYDQSDNHPTMGRQGPGDGRRRTRNTMRNARHGGGRVHYFSADELDTVPRPTVSAPPRIAPRRALETRTKTGNAAAAEGLRQTAMQRHSILTTNGAVDYQRGTGPVWLSDDPEFAARTRDERIRNDARRI